MVGGTVVVLAGRVVVVVVVVVAAATVDGVSGAAPAAEQAASARAKMTIDLRRAITSAERTPGTRLHGALSQLTPPDGAVERRPVPVACGP